MAYRHITEAPRFDGYIGQNWSIVVEPRQVKSMLMRLGFAWTPGAKMLVKYGKSGFRVEAALAWVGPASKKVGTETMYQLKGK